MAHAPLSTDDLAGRTGASEGAADEDRLDLDAPASETSQTAAAAEPEDVPLLDDAAADDFLDRWSGVQGRFVDDPQEAVQSADALVAELMQTLAQRFSQHRGELEQQWQQGGSPDTEQLRLALQQYRSFFQRLLAT